MVAVPASSRSHGREREARADGEHGPGAGRLVVVSPHLDDGVFSCGDLLASRPGSAVMTVFAGRPSEYGPLRGWDADAGFREGDDVVALRRAEDADALQALGAEPVWLDFLDAQYVPPCSAGPAVPKIADRLTASFERLGAADVCVPLGLFHSDHRLTTRACLRLIPELPRLHWFAYAEGLYRRIPGLLDRRLAALGRLGLLATPLPPVRPSASELKRRAVAAYASQLRALATTGRLGHEDAFGPERLWRLECR